MTERFKVDLRGIIDLAANHLYTSPDVFVREVIQNAVDALTARRRGEPDHRGFVRLELTNGEDDQPGTLCVVDNGIGLTTPEVHEFLSSVGGSSKREDAEAVAERFAEDDEAGFLGRFGIGLLSCFMVADEIVVVTKSARDADAPPVEWRGRADGGYVVKELPDSPVRPGTSVYLTAKEDAEEYFERERLIELARQYAEMLPHEVVVAIGSDEISVNQKTQPWKLAGGEEDEILLADLCQNSLGFKPLDIFPIAAPAGGVRGYGFIRADRTPRWGGENKLYAHGMYVSDHVYHLVPNWATFVGCILNADGLKLTASREGVHFDETLQATSEQIGAAIRERLANLLRRDRKRFELIMAVHDTEIRGLAVKDRDFFELIIDLLEFDTTLGPIRFGEFRREHDRMLVARTAEQYRRLTPVAAASGLRVFNGGYTYHEELLCRAAERHPELEVISFDSADLANHWPEPDDADRFERLCATHDGPIKERECEVVVRAFEPADVPAFFALGLDAEFHRQLDQTKSIASGLWNEVLDAMAPRQESLAPTRLCLNSRSRLVQRLATLEDPALLRTAIEVLYVQALMSGHHPLMRDELALLHDGMERLLTRCAATSEIP
ncbi:MAG TPA: HSP90 family protein [Phycisphaerae bacterium]|nr:HSP90 family protein [Phycisphaerae bacterium]HRW53220.1 HSP90 family protein [Phycisphaerae bacterium]